MLEVITLEDDPMYWLLYPSGEVYSIQTKVIELQVCIISVDFARYSGFLIYKIDIKY